jgi:hypothetical protein
MSINPESSAHDPYQVDFPSTLLPEEVLRAVIVDLKRPLAGVAGSVSILSDDGFEDAWPDAVQWIGRCALLMRRIIDAAETYLNEKTEKPSC